MGCKRVAQGIQVPGLSILVCCFLKTLVMFIQAWQHQPLNWGPACWVGLLQDLQNMYKQSQLYLLCNHLWGPGHCAHQPPLLWACAQSEHRTGKIGLHPLLSVLTHVWHPLPKHLLLVSVSHWAERFNLPIWDLSLCICCKSWLMSGWAYRGGARPRACKKLKARHRTF